MDELTTLDPCELSKTVMCGICFDDVVHTKANTVKCGECKRFTMCMDCFDSFIETQNKILYKHCHRDSLNVSCPSCRAGNGFAYWSIIYRNYKPMPTKKLVNDFDEMYSGLRPMPRYTPDDLDEIFSGLRTVLGALARADDFPRASYLVQPRRSSTHYEFDAGMVQPGMSIISVLPELTPEIVQYATRPITFTGHQILERTPEGGTVRHLL